MMPWFSDNDGAWSTVGSGRGSNKFSQYKGGKGGLMGVGKVGKGKNLIGHTLPVPLHNQFVHLQPLQQQPVTRPLQPGLQQQHLTGGLQPNQQQQQQQQQQQLLQQQQQQQQALLWQSNLQLQDWVCPACLTQHPHYHQVCGTCISAKAAAAKAKGKGKGKAKGGKNRGLNPVDPHQRPGRWRSSKGTPAHWKNDVDNFDMSVDDDDSDVDAKVDTCNADEVNKVLNWLKNKQKDNGVVEVLEQLHVWPKAKEPVITDPWRALQSTKDKLRNVTMLADAAKAKADELHEALKDADEAKDELISRKENLEQEVLELQQKALSSMNENAQPSGNDDCVSIVNELRTLYQQFGTPQPQTAESIRIYQLLFGTSTGPKGNDARPAAETASEAPASPADLHFGVDVGGSAFGPSRGSKAAQSPYAKGPAAAATGPNGKGIGLAAGESSPALSLGTKH